MKILALERSCDETAAAVVEDGRAVLSSVVYSQVEEHAVYGGVVPEIASRRHTEHIVRVTRLALEQASLCLSEIDAVAVTFARTGRRAAVGVNFAKGLALAAENADRRHHLRAHIARILAHPISLRRLSPGGFGGHSISSGGQPHRLSRAGTGPGRRCREAFDKAALAMASAIRRVHLTGPPAAATLRSKSCPIPGRGESA